MLLLVIYLFITSYLLMVSTDGTVEAVKQVFKDKVVVLRTNASLGGARYLGMKLVDTEWFAFIDSDVEILNGWLENAEKYMHNPKIYGVQGEFVSPHESNRLQASIQAVRPLCEIDSRVITRYGFYSFSGANTGHVLLRSSIIELLDPRIMFELRSGEDFYIAQQIVKAGFYYIRNPLMRAIHWDIDMKIRVLKALSRSLGENGILIDMNYTTFFSYALTRILSDLVKRNMRKLLIHSIQLIGSPISYVKTRRLTCNWI